MAHEAITEAPRQTASQRELATLTNEFASVRLSLDTAGHQPRLLVEDLETGESILLSPIELASLTLATGDDRLNWLRVGTYREERR
jgi:hypothetical protein